MMMKEVDMISQAQLLHLAKVKAGTKATWETVAKALGITRGRIKTYLFDPNTKNYREMPDDVRQKIYEVYDLEDSFITESETYRPKGNVLSISTQKGGVGKTTMAAAIASVFAKKGYRVLIIDMDPQGNLTEQYFPDDGSSYPPEIETELDGDIFKPGLAHVWNMFFEDKEIYPYPVSKNLSLIGSGLDLAEIQEWELHRVVNTFKTRLDKLRSRYDLVILDTLPSFGNLLAAAHASADWLIIPTELARFSRRGIALQLRTARNTTKQFNSNMKLLGVVINKSIFVNRKEKRLNNIQQVYLERLEEEFGDYLLKPIVAASSKFVESQAMGEPIDEYSPRSEAAIQINELAFELMRQIKIKEVS
ncbi:ParA family protein [Xenorhabdus nematophila]|uniref:ParA family protein n=1 Tax=Xenorhabdus nematophila TaxID=628 RepID=UPI0032B7EAB7